MPWANPSASGGSKISLGAGSFSSAKYGEAPRMSFALWAKTLVASTVPAEIAASVLISFSMAILSCRSDFIDPEDVGDPLCLIAWLYVGMNGTPQRSIGWNPETPMAASVDSQYPS